MATIAMDKDALGIVGAGTMGSGIALAALLGGLRVRLFDVQPAMLERARSYIEDHLTRKKRLLSLEHLHLTGEMEDLVGCGTLIEAAPEVLSMKQEIFARLSSLCPPPAILATNTSTLPVTAIAASASHPERVGGMHFFNPAPVMPLVEVIGAAQSSPETVTALAELARRLGKTPVIARDTPGFIVNRVARPFYAEALRLAGEGAAKPEVIDRIVRLGGGFRMGPFQLMDLIGIDINFAATQSVYEQTFHEPRYRPHLIQAQMVQQGALGRKTGSGFYDYTQNGPRQDEAPESIRPSVAPLPVGPIQIVSGSWAPGMAEALENHGYAKKTGAVPQAAVLTCGPEDDLLYQVTHLEKGLLPETPLLVQCANVPLDEVAAWLTYPQRLVGFDGLFWDNGLIVTLAAGVQTSGAARQAAEALFAGLGKAAAWVAPVPGLVLPRLVCALANEAAFALGEGVAEAEVIDRAMQLGANYPLGPLAWAARLGYRRVAAVMAHLQSEYGEERYRTAPQLKRWARAAG